jgi:hypothetical protein
VLKTRNCLRNSLALNTLRRSTKRAATATKLSSSTLKLSIERSTCLQVEITSRTVRLLVATVKTLLASPLVEAETVKMLLASLPLEIATVKTLLASLPLETATVKTLLAGLPLETATIKTLLVRRLLKAGMLQQLLLSMPLRTLASTQTAPLVERLVRAKLTVIVRTVIAVEVIGVRTQETIGLTLSSRATTATHLI